MNDFIGVTAICGDEGTGKTTMGLTFSKPLFHLDIDVGGIDRAIWRMPKLRVSHLAPDQSLKGIDWSQVDVVSKSYPKPIQLERLTGTTAPDSPDIRLTSVKKVSGMRELWQAITMDFVTVCQAPTITSIMIDSSTALWNIAHNTQLQIIQEKQVAEGKIKRDDDYRERLMPVEYGPANDRMRQLFHTARVFRKNLILTHYPTDEYGAVPDGKGGIVDGKTGRKIMDGFKETAKLSDLIVWLRIGEVEVEGNKQKTPLASILKCGIPGMGLGAVGLEVMAEFEGIINLRNMMKGGEQT